MRPRGKAHREFAVLHEVFGMPRLPGKLDAAFCSSIPPKKAPG
jgi:hypothetical protein